MLDIVKRPRAKEDLKGIWRYAFEEWDEAQANKYLAEVAQLNHNPKLGRHREEVRTGYRSLRINFTSTPTLRSVTVSPPG